jgi:hypothetical protein
MVLSLILASCGTTEETDKTGSTVENTPTTTTTTTKPVESTTSESRIDTPSADEKPIYGGTYTTIGGDPMGFDEAYTLTMMAWTLRLTNEELIMGDWAKGPAGTGEFEWFTGYLGKLKAETGCLARAGRCRTEKRLFSIFGKAFISTINLL